MAAPTPTWLPFLTKLLQYLGVVQNPRTYLDFEGSGFSFTDDAVNDRQVVNLGNSTNQNFGTDPLNQTNVQSFIEPAFATANATPKAAVSAVYAMPDLTMVDVVVTVVGKKAASADSFVQDYRARYTRNGTAPTIIGSIILGSNPVGTGTLSTASATLTVSGNSIVPQVTGVAATGITWTITMQVQPVTTAT